MKYYKISEEEYGKEKPEQKHKRMSRLVSKRKLTKTPIPIDKITTRYIRGKYESNK